MGEDGFSIRWSHVNTTDTEEKTTKSSRSAASGESTTQGSRVREYKDARVRRVNTSSSESTFNGSSCMERTSREQPRADTTMEFLDK